MKDWCEHFSGRYSIPDVWTCCPICGKERPKENGASTFPNNLHILLKDKFCQNCVCCDLCIHKMIEKIKQKIKERLPEEKPNNHKDFIVEYYSNGYNDCLSEVKKALGVE